jgi:hypothetical protein
LVEQPLLATSADDAGLFFFALSGKGGGVLVIGVALPPWRIWSSAGSTPVLSVPPGSVLWGSVFVFVPDDPLEAPLDEPGGLPLDVPCVP